MSAFIVSRNHIRFLVDGLASFSAITEPDTLAQFGQLLWDENIASVAYRYDNDPVEDLPGPIGETYIYGIHPDSRDVSIHPLALYKALRCYVYQSCEHPGWEESRAAHHIRTLEELCKNAMEATTGQTMDKLTSSRAYDELMWEIE